MTRPKKNASPDTTSHRVLLGGGWVNTVPVWLCAASRNAETPVVRDDYLGFR